MDIDVVEAKSPDIKTLPLRTRVALLAATFLTIAGVACGGITDSTPTFLGKVFINIGTTLCDGDLVVEQEGNSGYSLSDGTIWDPRESQLNCPSGGQYLMYVDGNWTHNKGNQGAALVWER